MTQYPNWFNQYADHFFAHHLAGFRGGPYLRFLQIGAFTGDATLYLLDNVLCGHGAMLVDVDTWEGSDEPAHDDFDFEDVERVYDERTSALVETGRLIKFKGSSLEFFATRNASLPPVIISTDERINQEQALFIRERFLLSVKDRTPLVLGGGIKITVPPSADPYDFIYIDGDHTAAGVLSDAVHAYPLLKVCGLIAFDDYLWKSGKGRLHDPAPAIDAFADLYADRLERLDNPPGQPDLQVWFRKTR